MERGACSCVFGRVPNHSCIMRRGACEDVDKIRVIESGTDLKSAIERSMLVALSGRRAIILLVQEKGES